MHDCDLGARNSCRLIALIKTVQGANDVDQQLPCPLHKYAYDFVYIDVVG